MVVFGGQDSSSSRLNDMVSLNLTKLIASNEVDWTVQESDNCALAVRRGSSPRLIGLVSLGVLLVGIVLVAFRYRQSQRFNGYRQLG